MHRKIWNNESYFSVPFFFAFLFSFFSFSLLFFVIPSCNFILKLLTQKCFYIIKILSVNYLCAIRHTTSHQSEAKEGGKEHETGAERVICEETQAKLTNGSAWSDRINLIEQPYYNFQVIDGIRRTTPKRYLDWYNCTGCPENT